MKTLDDLIVEDFDNSEDEADMTESSQTLGVTPVEYMFEIFKEQTDKKTWVDFCRKVGLDRYSRELYFKSSSFDTLFISYLARRVYHGEIIKRFKKLGLGITKEIQNELDFTKLLWQTISTAVYGEVMPELKYPDSYSEYTEWMNTYKNAVEDFTLADMVQKTIVACNISGYKNAKTYISIQNWCCGKMRLHRLWLNKQVWKHNKAIDKPSTDVSTVSMRLRGVYGKSYANVSPLRYVMFAYGYYRYGLDEDAKMAIDEDFWERNAKLCTIKSVIVGYNDVRKRVRVLYWHDNFDIYKTKCTDLPYNF